MRKPAFYICKNKDADPLHDYREADQRLCFRYIASAIPLLPKYEISSLQPSSVIAQPGLCQTRSETPKTGFLTRRRIFKQTALNRLISLSWPYICIMRKPYLGYPSKSETNGAVQTHKMAIGLNFRFRKKTDCTIYVVKRWR